MSTDLAKRLEALEHQLVETRSEVEQLRLQLHATERTKQLRTMREQVQCPACSGTKILHATKVLDRDAGDNKQPMALHKPSIWRMRSHGHFEVYVCVGCGLAEWYCDADGLKIDGKQFRMLERDTPDTAGPYR